MIKNRSKQVSNALIMLWIMLALSILHFILSSLNIISASPYEVLSSDYVFFTNIFSLILSACFIYLIGIGKNWARITYLVLFIIGMSATISILLPILSTNLIYGILNVAGIILGIIALILLFQKSSNTWFKSMKK